MTSLRELLDALPSTVTAYDEARVFAEWLRSDEAREVASVAFAEWDGAEFGQLSGQQQEIDRSAARAVLTALAAHVEAQR